MAKNLNILLSSFNGLGLPPTSVMTVSDTATVNDLNHEITDRLPATLQAQNQYRLILTTNSNRILSDVTLPLLDYAGSADILPLRLTAPLVGGKDFPNDESPQQDEEGNPFAGDTHPVVEDARAEGDAAAAQVDNNDSGAGNAGEDAGGEDAGGDE